MPLLKGKENFGANVSELIHKYKKTGKIGTSHPANKAKARKQALAIAFSTLKEK